MLDRNEELKLLGFLATLAGLLGVVVSVNQFQLGSFSSATVRAWFSIILVVFMFASALAYLSALQGNDVRQFNMAVLGYFSGLLGMVRWTRRGDALSKRVSICGVLHNRGNSLHRLLLDASKMA